MRLRPSSGRVVGVALGLLVFVSACRSPGSERIVGPDGSAMAHVHCGSEQGECFRIAGELCPSGYEMHAVLSGSDGNFLVRCRTAAAQAVVAACSPASSPAPVAGRDASSRLIGVRHACDQGSLAPDDRTVARDEPVAAARNERAVRAPNAAPTQPQGDIDIGY